MAFFLSELIYTSVLIILPSYAASSALVVQIMRNEESIRIEFTHSMKEWIDFAYTLNVCLSKLSLKQQVNRDEGRTCMHEIYAFHQSPGLESVDVFNTCLI